MKQTMVAMVYESGVDIVARSSHRWPEDGTRCFGLDPSQGKGRESAPFEMISWNQRSGNWKMIRINWINDIVIIPLGRVRAGFFF